MKRVNCRNKISPYIQREGLISTYFNEIRKIPLLTSREEKKLLLEVKSKNETIRKSALDKLVLSNQRFIASAAKEMTDGNDFLDLMIEGNRGLIVAIDKFNVDKEVRLITYGAWWIKKYIENYIDKHRNIVVPPNASKIRMHVTEIRRKFLQSEERLPTVEEIQTILSNEYNFNVKNKEELEVFQSVSIENSESSNEEDFVGDALQFNKITASNNINNDIKVYDNAKIVNDLLNTLNEKDRYIITRLYGIGCSEKSYEEIANEMNLSKERIRQKRKAIEKKLGSYKARYV